MKYVTEDQVQKEIKFRKKWNGDKDICISDLINYYCQGAVSTISNKLYEHLDNGYYLIYSGYHWRYDAPVWEIRNSETDEEFIIFENLEELVDKK